MNQTVITKKQPVPFGKYLLLDRVNIGGMAEVWRGKMFGAGGFERLVAIKRILPNIAEDEEFISMFIDEAKIAVQLTHANIAQIYDLGNINNNYFIAMEYIPGRDLRSVFERSRKKGEPAPIPLTCYVISKLCEGLDYAHRKKDGMGRDMNIVHRDVSPQNVLISYEGEVKVIDFGIAKAAGKASKTQAGILKGKFGYMSPEQIRGLPLDRRSDIFAIGICLYEMLTGERLFVGESDFSVLEKVRKAEVQPPSVYNKRVPEALERIVLKALAREVEARYQYGNELADDLQRFLITSDSIFSRKDLMSYMKATFAEDVEREKIRLQEYAQIKPSGDLLTATEPAVPAAGGTPKVPVVVTAPIPLRQPAGLGAAPVAPLQLDEPAATVISQPAGLDLSKVPTQPIDPVVPKFDDEPEPKTMPAGPAALNALELERSRRTEEVPRWVSLPTPPPAAPGPAPASTPLPPPAKAREAPASPPALNPRPVASALRPPPPAASKWPLAVALLLVFGVIGAGGAVYYARQNAKGFLVLDVPPEMRAKTHVNLNGKDLGVPGAWPLLQEMKVGNGIVVLSADGYENAVQTLKIEDGKAINLRLELHRSTTAATDRP